MRPHGQRQAIWTLGVVLAAAGGGCEQQSSGGSRLGGQQEQQEMPKVQVKLPPPPTFEREHAPEKYADGTLSVYGVRKNMKTTLNQPQRVTGVIIEVYECPPCPKGATCKPCDKPHFWVSDRANGPKDDAMMVTDYLPEDPKTKKKVKFEVGTKYVITGTFAKSSATGFSHSDGLMVFESATPAEAPAAE